MATLPLDNHLDGAYAAQLERMIIGAQTPAETAAGAKPGAITYDPAINSFQGFDGAVARHLPWENATPATSFNLNSEAAADANSVGLSLTGRELSIKDKAGAIAPLRSGTSTVEGANGHALSFDAPATGGTDYTLSFPGVLPASKVAVLVDGAGAVTYEPMAASGIPEYADNAARVADGYAGVWRDPDGDLFKAPAATGASVPYVLSNSKSVVRTTPPTAPAAGDVYKEGDTIKYVTPGGDTKTLATADEIANAMNWRGTYDASAGRPDANGVADIEAGDVWIVTTAGTIAGIEGEDALEVGDLLVATVDAPATGAGYAGIQTNSSVDMSGFLAFENQTVNLAGAQVVANYTTLTQIHGAQAYDSTGRYRNTLDVQIGGNGTSVVVDGITTLNNLRVLAFGQV